MLSWDVDRKRRPSFLAVQQLLEELAIMLQTSPSEVVFSVHVHEDLGETDDDVLLRAFRRESTRHVAVPAQQQPTDDYAGVDSFAKSRSRTSLGESCDRARRVLRNESHTVNDGICSSTGVTDVEAGYRPSEVSNCSAHEIAPRYQFARESSNYSLLRGLSKDTEQAVSSNGSSLRQSLQEPASSPPRANPAFEPSQHLAVLAANMAQDAGLQSEVHIKESSTDEQLPAALPLLANANVSVFHVKQHGTHHAEVASNHSEVVRAVADLDTSCETDGALRSVRQSEA